MTKNGTNNAVVNENEQQKLSRFGEAFQQAFEGISMRKFRDIVGQDIVIYDYAERFGRNGKMFIIKGQDLTSNDYFTIVVYNQNIQRKISIAKNKGQLPMIGKIIDNDGYFDIV